MNPDQLFLVMFIVIGSILAVGTIAIIGAIVSWLVQPTPELLPPSDRHNCYVDEWYHTALKIGQVYYNIHSEQITRCDGTTYWLVWVHWEDPNACIGWDDLIGFDMDPPERFVLSNDYKVRGIVRSVPPLLPASSQHITCNIPSSTD